MIRKILLFTVVIVLLTDLLIPQESSPDSVKYPFARRDTLKTIRIKSNLYWYDFEHKIHTIKDSSEYELFAIKNEKGLNYGDMGDVFRNKPLWYKFDLQERGRPCYISSVNKYPHQTTFYYAGVLMNDPVHGMFNGQFIPVNFIRYVEADFSAGSLNNLGYGSGSALNIIPLTLHTKAPWSRIIYKQDGSFGYRDLDISFVKPISETFAIQLGGINKGYDGGFYNSAYKGTNYRGEITWQYKENIYMRWQFFLNRDLVGITPDSAVMKQEIPFPEQKELRDDYFFDITWLPFDSTDQRFHLTLYKTFSSRKFQDTQSNYHIINKHNRYGMDLNYSQFIGTYELLCGSSIFLPKVWGTGFPDTYSVYTYNGYLLFSIPFSESMKLTSTAQACFREDFDIQVSPGLRFTIKPAANQNILIDLNRSIRFPNASEFFFHYDTLYGNPDLLPEIHRNINARYSISSSNKWSFSLQGGYFDIENEIIWQEPQFINSTKREFTFLGINAEYGFWKLSLESGGQYTFADLYLTPRASCYGRAHYQDIWLSGAVKIDAYGSVNAYDEHTLLCFEPRLQRFYLSDNVTDPYFTLNWKIVAGVKNAKIFIEMDNALSWDYEIIKGYSQYYRHVRFGVNWFFWD